MQLDEEYRVFLLGMADAEAEAAIEEGILEGHIDPDHLRRIEEELIDDHLFGRLSPEEDHFFRSAFLSTPARVGELNFATALYEYSAKHAPPVSPRKALTRLREMATRPWLLPFAMAVSCAILVTLWLGVRNLRLSHELAEARRQNDEHKRVIASMFEEQARRTNQPAIPVPSAVPSGPPPSAAGQADLEAKLQLPLEEQRALSAIPVLHLGQRATKVFIVLELPFKPESPFSEEVLGPNGKQIWSRQFSITAVSHYNTTTMVVPARLLVTGQYTLRVEFGVSGNKPASAKRRTFSVWKE